MSAVRDRDAHTKETQGGTAVAEEKPTKPAKASAKAQEIPTPGGDPDTRKRAAKTRLAAASAAGDSETAKAAQAELDAISKES